VSRLTKLLAASLVAIGVPAVAVAWWRALAVRHPLIAITLLLAWMAVLVIGAVMFQIASGPISRRLQQLGGAIDLALGRRFTRWDRRYRRWSLDRVRFLGSAGLVTAGDFNPELDAVVVDVSLAPRPPQHVSGGVLATVPAEITARRSVMDFIGRERPGVFTILGAPGSGKTTLLRHVVRRIAERPGGFRRPIPILVELRDYGQQIVASPHPGLPQLVRSTLPPEAVTGEPPEWLEDRFRRGKCVVMLDGLDEVARAEDREGIMVWLNNQVASYPDNDYVITSRPAGYQTAGIGAASVPQVRPFTADQIRQFLLRWYTAVGRHEAEFADPVEWRSRSATAGPEVDRRSRKAAEDLIEQLGASPALRDLSINPLLLTMIANVHRYHGALPHSRAALYGEV
jgi:hypothetical protein